MIILTNRQQYDRYRELAIAYYRGRKNPQWRDAARKCAALARQALARMEGAV